MLLVLPLLLLFIGLLTAWMFSLPALRHRFSNAAVGWFLALFPASAFGLLLAGVIQSAGKALTFSVPWVPSLGLSFSLYLDGLSALFGLLITGIGLLVVIYTGYYFDGSDEGVEYRFFTYILLFMLAMLGLVLAGDLITLFLFWEGTSISSFLLIAYKFKDAAARNGAFKSLFITGGGGIALLAGFVFMITITGSADFATVLSSGEALRASPFYLAFFGLVALGAFTKSAQFPAHIWLPEAMSAPTPASAFLHSATMVKAGIYLLARLNPALGGTEAWFWTLSLFGLFTMLVGAYLGFKQNDLKPLLAYSTISQLGVLVALIGQDTEIAFKALVIGILAHALYKSALFMSAGIIDHETGTRELRRLGGLRTKMPIMFWIVLVASFSMAGLPPLFGFLAKETLLATATHPGLPAVVDWVFPAATVIAGALLLGQAGVLVSGVFLGKPADPKRPPKGHDPHWGFWLAPAIPAALSLLVGIAPVELVFLAEFLASAARAAFGEKVKVSLALWTGINVPLILSMLAISLGGLLYWQRVGLRPRLQHFLPGLTVNSIFNGTISGLDGLAKTATRLQGGRLRTYIRRMMFAALILIGALGGAAMLQFLGQSSLAGKLVLGELTPLRLFSLVLLVAAGLASVFLRRDMHAVIALGVSGLGVAVWMALEPAPDVALVQIVVDILATVILILSLNIIPRKLRDRANEAFHSRAGKLRDWLLAGGVGLFVALVTFISLMTRPRASVVSPFYAESAKPLTGAKDIVGAIVVDFRGMDTLIEIMVFGLAALGIYSLLHYTANQEDHVHAAPASPPPATPLGIFGLPTSSLLHMLAYILLPLAFLLGVTHMMYGHDQPGDGFTAGVIMSLAISLWYVVFGYETTRDKLKWLNRINFAAAGLLLACLNALAGMALGDGFFAPVNYGQLLGLARLLPTGFGLTSSFIFEVSIALTVMGAATLIIDNLGHPRQADPEEEDVDAPGQAQPERQG